MGLGVNALIWLLRGRGCRREFVEILVDADHDLVAAPFGMEEIIGGQGKYMM